MSTPNQKLPVYELVINEKPDSELEVNFIALVDRPAIEKNFMTFKDQKRLELNFAAVDDERFIISGPVMLADMPIYRKDEYGTEYMVIFKEETIYKIAQKFFEKNYNSNFNIMHQADKTVEGVCVFESFITDDKRGIAPMAGYEDAKNGSWFISAIVKNPDTWAAVKNGDLKGFSVEGIFGFVAPQVDEYADIFKQIKDILAADLTDGDGAYDAIMQLLNEKSE